MPNKRDERTAEPIFIGLEEVAGFYTAMHLGLTALSVDSEIVITKHYPYGMVPVGNSCTSRLAGRLRTIESKLPSPMAHLLIPGLRLLLHLWLLVWSLGKFESYLFAFGRSFLPGNIDLPILRFFGKRTIVMLGHGSEARPPFLNAKYLSNDGQHPPPEVVFKLTQRMAARLRYVEKHASLIVCSPQTGHLLTRPFVKYSSLGRPTVIPVGVATAQRETTRADRRVRVLHAPSHRLGKGSDRIREIVGELIDEGFDIDYEELSGVSNRVVLAKVQECDIVIDQLYSDIPLSRFGTEAALFGKPCLVGGYGWAHTKDEIDSADLPPALHVAPDEIAETLRKLVQDRDWRIDAGERLRCFVLRQWSAEVVAGRLLRLLSETVPPQWLFCPADINYLNGWGMSEEQGKESVRRLLEFGGTTALAIQDNPKVLAAFRSWALQ